VAVLVIRFISELTGVELTWRKVKVALAGYGYALSLATFVFAMSASVTADSTNAALLRNMILFSLWAALGFCPGLLVWASFVATAETAQAVAAWASARWRKTEHFGVLPDNVDPVAPATAGFAGVPGAVGLAICGVLFTLFFAAGGSHSIGAWFAEVIGRVAKHPAPVGPVLSVSLIFVVGTFTLSRLSIGMAKRV